MITQVRLSNLRLFEGPKIWDIDASSLMAICGANNSGKSTILKSLLFLRNNILQSQEVFDASTIITFQSKEIDLGTFSSLVSHRDERRDISIGITWDWSMGPPQFQAMFNGIVSPSVLAQPEPVTVSLDITIGVVQESARKRKDDLFASLPTLENRSRPVLKNSTTKIRIGNRDVLHWWAERVQDKYRLVFSRESAQVLAPLVRVSPTELARLNNPRSRGNFSVLGVLAGWLPGYYLGPMPDAQGKGTSKSQAFYSLPFVMESTNRFIRNQFSNIEYLGPLRAPARRYYSVQEDTRSSELDAAGEKLPFVLRDMRSIQVDNVDPGSSTLKHETLESALNTWLHYLRLGSVETARKSNEIEVKDIREVLLEAELTSANGLERHALADSGFGYSQVLPIIVKTLISRRGSTILIEQPELHLNPSLQVRLAEFFVAMARSRRQLIVETHSEHIVNALRVFAAEDQKEDVSKMVSIYYVESSKKIPQILKLGVSADGLVDGWPPEFFGDSLMLASRLLRAQANKRKSRREVK